MQLNNRYIIFISPNIRKDGAEKSLVSLQVFLNKEKNIETITIIPSHGPIEELLKENNIEYIIHPFQGNVNAGKGTKPIRGIAKMSINVMQAIILSQNLKLRKLNIIGVHSNTITSEFGYYLARFLNVQHIWHIREFGKLDFNFDFELGMQYMKKCTSRAAKIICNSKAVMEYYQNYFDKNLLTYVHNGVNIIAKGVSDWNNKTFKMVMVGRLSPEKGQLLAIEACRKMLESGYDDFVLDFYGNGNYEDVIRQKIMDNGLDKNIHLCGYSNDIKLSSYHVGLMCSHHEAFGRVTVEYMINSIPVIGVNTGGTPEIINNGVTGILFEKDSVEGLYQAMEKLFVNRNMCQTMGKSGRERALLQFSVKRYCENIYKVYEQVLL